MISDTDSTDSEEGIRFKTTSTRNKDFRRRSSPHDNRERDRDRDRDRNKRYDKSRDEIVRSKNGGYESITNSRDQRSPQHRRKIISDELSPPTVSSQSMSDEKEKASKHKSKKSKHRKHKKEKLETKIKADSSSEDNSLKISLNETSVTPTVTSISVEVEPVIDDVFGPSLPPTINIIVPPKIDMQDASSSSTATITSTLTEDLNHKEKRTFGPALPSKGLISPSLSTEDLSSDDEFDVIGPLPESSKQTKAHYELEKRALELKMSALNDDNNDVRSSTIREEWMLELPQINSVASLGLVARQFRTKERPDFKDRGGWTETPQDKEGKNKEEKTQEEIQKALAEDIKIREISRRDEEQAEIAKKHKKKHKRDESLLEIHEKKLKKKRKKEEKTEKITRRTFDRDIDLKVNRFDEAQKKSIVKKAQLLDTRFSSGAAKYL